MAFTLTARSVVVEAPWVRPGSPSSLAWDVNGKPLGGFNNPVETFHRLFSSDNLPLEAQQARLAEQRSILDTVRESAGDLRRGLNKADTDKLEEYLSGIRDIETRLAKEEKWLEIPRPAAPLAEPKATPALEGREEIRLHYELLAAALQTDSTRVASYRLPVGTLLKSLAITVNSHDMSHYHLHQDTSKREASHARDLALGELIAVFFDDLEVPLMEAIDKTFTSGRVGIGSFDDMNDFTHVKVVGRKAEAGK